MLHPDFAVTLDGAVFARFRWLRSTSYTSDNITTRAEPLLTRRPAAVHSTKIPDSARRWCGLGSSFTSRKARFYENRIKVSENRSPSLERDGTVSVGLPLDGSLSLFRT